MNSTRDAVSPAMRAASDDICGQYSEIFSADTRDLMGFYVVMRKLLMEVRRVDRRTRRIPLMALM